MTDTIKISRELRPLIDRVCELEQQHGGIRAAAKAIGIDPGYLSRLKDGYKTNPSDEVLSLLGLERSVLYRAKGKHGAVDLAYTDPEAQPGENSLHTVSSLIAGQAFNSLCRMLGGRWPEARMEQEAPEAYRFFMALLATPPADAADMGGQAGEEVLAVVTLAGLFHGGSGPELGDIDIEPNMRALERVQCELVNSSDDAHIELIDRRILAQHRQQAGKLVEAQALLSILRGMINCTPENDIDRCGAWISTKHPVIKRIDAFLDK